MSKIKIPAALKDRLADVASKHDLGTADEAATHFVERGMKSYDVPDGKLKKQLAYLVDEQGYSSADEAIEHLLIRGLRAYEEPAASQEELEARLRGLGYID